ncbi:hypothetical protein E4T42_03199 [Aureobasidium subglaciale]|nr:hypothetical protein E4T42_03199 [Aureobasidium subglaciale]
MIWLRQKRILCTEEGQKKTRLLWKETGSLRVLLLRLTSGTRGYLPMPRIELRPRVIVVCPFQPSRPHTPGEKAGSLLGWMTGGHKISCI